MELTYQLERDDYWAYYQSVTRGLPPWRRIDFLPLLALSALIAYGHWSPNTLHPAGCRIQSAVMETRTSWAKVTELRQSDKLIVFLLSPRYGFIVPNRAFPTPQQAQAFLETAQAYRTSALNGTAPILPPVSKTWPPAPLRLF